MCSRHLEEGAGASYADQLPEPYSAEPARRFRVHLQADQWDNDSFRYYTEVWAPDPEEARRLVWRMNPKAGIRRVEVVA